jgi:hypothetical protein
MRRRSSFAATPSMLTFVAGLPAGISNSKAPGDFASVMMVSPGFPAFARSFAPLRYIG